VSAANEAAAASDVGLGAFALARRPPEPLAAAGSWTAVDDRVAIL